jgi:hypothetical protein
MSDIIQMSNALARIPDQVFPFMSLPFELRQNVYRHAAVKRNSYIGQADKHGVRCAIGRAQSSYFHSAHADFQTSIANNLSEEIHEPVGCLHPIHEIKQIHQDFLDYRCVNLALSCSQVHKELTEVFFKDNGFELRNGRDLMEFFLLIGNPCMNLISTLRLYHNINLSNDDFQATFGQLIDRKTLKSILEIDYLVDDTPASPIVQVLKFLQSCKTIKNFDLTYRLEVPGEFFNDVEAAGTSEVLDYALAFAHDWLGKSMQWDIHTKSVLEKLRQDNGVRSTELIKVEKSAFTPNLLACEIAVVLDEKELFLEEYAGAMAKACLNHAETCVESAGFGRNRIEEAP